MDTKAFFKLSYGLYIISTVFEGKRCGCIVNTFEQVTSSPPQVCVAVNKENYTAKMIQKSGVFAAVVLTESADMSLISEFGFKTSESVDKFKNYQSLSDINNVPYINQNIAARFSCKVKGLYDAGSHLIFIGEVLDSEVLSTENVMTYAYYHVVKKGYTPPKASSFNASENTAHKTKGYRCSVCNYILESDTIPEDFVCPICKQGKDKLIKL